MLWPVSVTNQGKCLGQVLLTSSTRPAALAERRRTTLNIRDIAGIVIFAVSEGGIDSDLYLTSSLFGFSFVMELVRATHSLWLKW